MKYICTAPEKEVKNFKGESLGIQGERGLFYHKNIGKHRCYRHLLEDEDIETRLLEFKSKEEAQALCDKINEAYNDNFKISKR